MSKVLNLCQKQVGTFKKSFFFMEKILFQWHQTQNCKNIMCALAWLKKKKRENQELEHLPDVQQWTKYMRCDETNPTKNKQTNKLEQQQQQKPTTNKKGKDEKMKTTVQFSLSSQGEHTLHTLLEKIPRQQRNNSSKATNKNPPAFNIQKHQSLLMGLEEPCFKRHFQSFW